MLICLLSNIQKSDGRLHLAILGRPNKGQGVENMAGKASMLNIFSGLFRETFPCKLEASQLESDFFSPLLSFPPPFLLRQANGLDKS